MVDACGVSKNKNSVHHDQFVRSFVRTIANALQAYGVRHGNTFSTSFQKKQFYGDFAWGGLEDTSVFKSLSSAERTRISNRLRSEQYGTDSNGNPMPKKGKSGGC